MVMLSSVNNSNVTTLNCQMYRNRRKGANTKHGSSILSNQ